MSDEKQVQKYDDLNDLDYCEYTHEVVHPATGEFLGLTLVLRSPMHPDVIKCSQASTEKQRAAARRRKPFTVRQEQAEAIRVNAACITAWKWEKGAGFNGKQPEHSYEAAIKLLEKRWLAEQVADILMDESNFFSMP